MNGHLKPTHILALYLVCLSALFIYHESGILPSSLGSVEGQHEKEEPKKDVYLPRPQICLSASEQIITLRGAQARTGSHPFNYLPGRRKLEQRAVVVVAEKKQKKQDGTHPRGFICSDEDSLLDLLTGLTFDRLNNSVFHLRRPSFIVLASGDAIFYPNVGNRFEGTRSGCPLVITGATGTVAKLHGHSSGTGGTQQMLPSIPMLPMPKAYTEPFIMVRAFEGHS